MHCTLIPQDQLDSLEDLNRLLQSQTQMAELEVSYQVISS